MPGLSLAIINDNEIVHHQVYGVQNLENETPISKSSIFEGASLSKPIFAYFVMKMVEKGMIDLDRPLYEYWNHPAIDSASRDWYKLITPRMVLSHSTGFPNHAQGKIISIPFKPGTDFLYSGEAYQYLAAIIGLENGVQWREKFNAIFEGEVTEPLKMKNTSFLWNDHLAEHKVYGHKNGKPTDNGLGGWSGKTFNAFSSIHSEASEYALFIQAMLKREGLSADGFDEMLATQNKFDETNPLRKETGQTGWGLGFAQKETRNGLMHLHTGNNHDFQSYAMFVPDQEYGIVLFTNSGKMIPLIQGLEGVLGKQF
ncbi:serine hydrolase [Roseivirga misakiensis]|uniref:Serine hydrolase n=2 Tax=Roseivirga misakiensis TaxID=1563681 RepID=A0A1E5T2H1_9BACT|nr:serine hydrolase [Roseivirga misakiensis]